MNRLRTIAVSFSISVSLLFLATGCANTLEGLRSHEPPPDTASYARLQPGPFEMASVDFSFVDESRTTMPNNEYPGASSRTLGVTVWYPENAEGARPLLIYSHGFTGHRREMLHVIEHLTRYGYVVAGLDFPLTTGAAPGGPNPLDLARQPGDVRFVIDSVLELAREEAPLAGRIDPERIAVAGLSYGGLTTTLVAFHSTEGDPRIKAAISVAGPAQMFTSRYYANGGPPFLMIAGTYDALVPYEHNALTLLDDHEQAGLLTFDAGTHIGFVHIPNFFFRFLDNPDEAACSRSGEFGEDGVTSEGNGLDGNPLEGLGGLENGVDFDAWVLPCQGDVEFARAMRPQRQRLLTSLGVRAFLDSLFAEDAEDREASGRFLREVLPREMADVQYHGGL